MPKAQETVLEINLKALKHNFDYLKSKLKPETKFMAVVKAYAYGSDSCEIALYLEKLKVDYFAVAYIEEGLALRKGGVTAPIMVLHPQIVNFDILLENRLEPSLYNEKTLKEFITALSKKNIIDYPVHLKFNTGLNRLGFWHTDVEMIANVLAETKTIKVKSLLSHLAASEDLNEKEFTLNQIKDFKSIAENFTKQVGYKPLHHICNTSGILNYPDAHFDLVRSGIGLYGFGNSEKENQFFRPIGTLKTVISQIHTIIEGESIGYNRGYKATETLRSATLPIGHADGIGRQYGHGKGFVTINGKRAPIIGNVCMDMIMVNVTDIDCEEGDEVIIFGESSSAETLAETANTISYELITHISQRVMRVIIE
ncbi:alanine racemase [Tamlana sp. 2_MG-2023]|uniref:alanine racemase n=1 Tax=unclassified Tamlana TaxID=2614803 RepID=UPI0026E38795|nr:MULTISPECIES: alanine racemase [unclassified Tamlana]MDO6759631.1 alanine racemase [Tamlana sp. 2_MG-2023]MDO6791254.1 alanine racemase [Tamlana sp. 1_MG-2023]